MVETLIQNGPNPMLAFSIMMVGLFFCFASFKLLTTRT